MKAGTLAAPAKIFGTAGGLGVSSGVVPYYVTNEAGVSNTWSESSGITLLRTSANTDTIYVSFLSTFKSGTISVVSSNGCTTSKAASLAVSNKSGMEQLNEGDAHHNTALGNSQLMNLSELYPNPTSSGNLFNLQISASQNTVAFVQVYDIMGNVLTSKQVALNKGDNLISNALIVPAGIYLVRITDVNSTETYTKRLVIQ